MNQTTPIFTPEQLITYAETRLTGKVDGKSLNLQDIKIIKLHNGILPNQLIKSIGDENQIPYQVEQVNGREPLFYVPSTKTLHIPQWSGFKRRDRYEDMILALLAVAKEASTKDAKDLVMKFESLEREGNPRMTDVNYSNLAYDFIKHHLSLKQAERALPSTVVIGPIDAFEGKVRSEKIVNDYLNAQFIETGKGLVLHLGYVYGDQAGLLIEQYAREFNAATRTSGKENNLEFLMFGRFASLEDEINRHDLIFPTGCIDQTDIYHKGEYKIDAQRHITNLDNVLAPKNDMEFLNFNAHSVVKQTTALLEHAKSFQCSSIDMETDWIAKAAKRANMQFANLEVNFGCVGYVSDKPLHLNEDGTRDTVAIELNSNQGRDNAAGVILDYLNQTR